MIVAKKVGGVEASDGSLLSADEKIDGGPSVLFDAVALLPSAKGAEQLTREATADLLHGPPQPSQWRGGHETH